MEKREKHFVLVHGACHGAWCWYKVSTLLRSAGHKVTVLDMAASGKHPKQVHEVQSLTDYLEPLIEFMASLPAEERVILVGHSIGGLSISVAMEKFPEKVSVAAFCTAVMPNPDLGLTTFTEEYNRSVDSYMDSTYTFDDGPNKQPTSILFGPNFMASKFYQLSPPECTVNGNFKSVPCLLDTRVPKQTTDLTLAELLVRPFPMSSNVASFNEVTTLTKERYGSVSKAYIVCDQDNIFEEDLQRWMIEKYPIDEVMVIPGSDHMAMFSKPKELCCCLQEIADKYA